MKTSLIIPFKNEVLYAEYTMRTVYTYLHECGIDFELIVVDDSTDGTWDILQAFEKIHQNVIVVRGGHPTGYGTALRKGFSVSSGDILIPFNGDLSDSLDDVITYIQLIEDGYDMALGSRFMAEENTIISSDKKKLISQLGNTFIQFVFCIDCSDITNSFKAFRKDVLEDIQPIATGYNIGTEIALKGIVKKYKYVTVPVTYTARQYGESKMPVLKTFINHLLTIFKIKFLKTQ